MIYNLVASFKGESKKEYKLSLIIYNTFIRHLIRLYRMTRNKIKIISLVDDEIDTDECFCLLVSLFYFFFCMMQRRYANTQKDTTMNKIITSIDVQLHNLYRYIFVRMNGEIGRNGKH